MSTNDPRQQEMIREAMKAIAERRPGRTRLVYDKSKRTIVAMAENTQSYSALNITAEDADMFARCDFLAALDGKHPAPSLPCKRVRFLGHSCNRAGLRNPR